MSVQVLQVIYQGLATKAFYWGLGWASATNSSSLIRFIEFQKWGWISNPFSVSVSVLARISASVTLIQAFRTKVWLKWFLCIFTALQIVTCVALLVAMFTQSKPIQGLWDSTVQADKSGGRLFLILVLIAQGQLFTLD